MKYLSLVVQGNIAANGQSFIKMSLLIDYYSSLNGWDKAEKYIVGFFLNQCSKYNN